MYFPFNEKLFYEKMNYYFLSRSRRYRKCNKNGISCKFSI